MYSNAKTGPEELLGPEKQTLTYTKCCYVTLVLDLKLLVKIKKLQSITGENRRGSFHHWLGSLIVGTMKKEKGKERGGGERVREGRWRDRRPPPSAMTARCTQLTWNGP